MYIASTSGNSTRLSVLAGLLLLTAGCATQPVSNSEAAVVPGDRILDRQYIQAAQDTGEVTVKRDSGFAGAACPTRIYVDGKPVADIKAAEKVVLHLPAGDHILSASPTGVCGGSVSEVKATVKGGAQASFRVGYGSAGEFALNPTAF